VDARPSDAIALALRAQAPLRAADHVIEAAGESA
jgi:bifunctional DNase/RNase